MIFNIGGHIDMIRNGLKTQTRRLNRGIYKVGKDYAVQRKRGVKAEPDIRIVMDKIWGNFRYITVEDALVEGGYLPEDFEKQFRELYPGWEEAGRWVFEFHAVEVRK